MADQPTDDAKRSLPIDLSRRQFLQSIGLVAGAGAAFADGLLRHPKQVEASLAQPSAKVRQTRDSIVDIWGDRTPHFGKWNVRIDERTLAEPERWVQSACVLCSYGCALDIGVKDNKIIGVRGREVDQVNHGRLGPKGLHGWIANNSQERLTRPLIRRNGSLQPASWDEADLPGYRNRDNPAHIADLARIWNVDPVIIPKGQPMPHTMQIFADAQQGAIKMLWISCTNPAVSLPNLHRIRSILDKEDLFVIVQDAFLTETAQQADVVLPAAIWGEKTGTFTNADRTVHISYKAIEPPGEARCDLEIFLDYARRMDFRDKDGQPLIKWSDSQSAFEAWKECSKGRPCDYSALSYAKLTGNSGIQIPCNPLYPNGKERQYTNGVFNTDPDYCQTYGHDFVTGRPITREEYLANNPQGRALIKATDYVPPAEQPDAEYPLWLTTGRVVYHWHTRTKTARSPELNAAAPDAFVQLSDEDAKRYGIQEGDLVEVKSRRGQVQQPARIGDIEPGLIFIPFHYSYWDHPDRLRAANELTLTVLDPVSKQPHFKYAAVRIRKITQS